MGKTKQWKSGGDQDKFIVQLIKKGKIMKSTKPIALKTEYPQMFSDFNLNVVRNHLNILKRSNGLYLDGETDDEESGDQEYDESIINRGNSSTIAGCVANIHHNYPILCNVFKDPENQFEKVVLAVVLPGGAQDPAFELSEDGMVALIKYGWPKTMYNLEDLFKKELQTKQINGYHPKILCLKNALESVRDRVDARPEGVIKVDLPIKVQTATDTWSKGGLKREDETYLAFAQFNGFIKEYNKTSSDSKLIFDM